MFNLFRKICFLSKDHDTRDNSCVISCEKREEFGNWGDYEIKFRGSSSLRPTYRGNYWCYKFDDQKVNKGYLIKFKDDLNADLFLKFRGRWHDSGCGVVSSYELFKNDKVFCLGGKSLCQVDDFMLFIESIKISDEYFCGDKREKNYCKYCSYLSRCDMGDEFSSFSCCEYGIKPVYHDKYIIDMWNRCNIRGADAFGRLVKKYHYIKFVNSNDFDVFKDLAESVGSRWLIVDRSRKYSIRMDEVYLPFLGSVVGDTDLFSYLSSDEILDLFRYCLYLDEELNTFFDQEIEHYTSFADWLNRRMEYAQETLFRKEDLLLVIKRDNPSSFLDCQLDMIRIREDAIKKSKRRCKEINDE